MTTNKNWFKIILRKIIINLHTMVLLEELDKNLFIIIFLDYKEIE